MKYYSTCRTNEIAHTTLQITLKKDYDFKTKIKFANNTR